MEPKYTPKELKAKYSNIMYKTHNKSYGTQVSQVPPDKQQSLNRKFTTEWAAAGMYKNEGLNVAIEKERYIDGSKDWMEKLN